MNFIAGYSSDNSSIDSDHVSSTNTISVNTKHSKQSGDQASSSKPNSCKPNTHGEEQKSTNSQQDPPFILSYSQEYSMNVKQKTNAFFYLPWNPSGQIKKRLQSASKLALQSLRKEVVDFDKRFACNSSVDTRIVDHGMFGLSNRNSMTQLHVSLFPNALLPKYQLKQLSSNIQRAVKRVQIPPELIHRSKISPLDMMLSDGKQKQKISLRFQMDNHLHLYKSTKTGSLFVGIGISKFSETEGTQLLSQYKYLTSVSRTIEDQANSLNIPYLWSQFNVPQNKNRGDLSTMYYHLSLVVCELTPRGKRMNESEYLATKQMLSQVDTSKFMKDIYFEVDHMILTTPDRSMRISLV